MSSSITPEILLNAYASGYFPMAKSRDDPQLYWFCPDMRGILPLDAFHIPRSLAKLLRKRPFEVTMNQAFTEVMQGCAQRPDTWINDEILRLYGQLHAMGFAHSVECWQGGQLVGGIYGVALGRAFFAESMFSRVPNASKVALVHLVDMLKQSGYTLLDTQYANDHISQFGVIEIAKEEYMKRLGEALGTSLRGA